MSLLVWGMIALLLGNAGQFIVPYYVGKVIDAMAIADFDSINNLCIQLAVIIVV
jgi:hypothetical protein